MAQLTPSNGQPAPPLPRLSLHLLPGLFGSASLDFLERLDAGLSDLRAEPPDPPGAWAALAPTAEAQNPSSSAFATLQGRPGLKLLVETLSVPPPDRFLISITLLSKKPGLFTHKDLELTLLGLSCAALAHESQGAALIGSDLGPIGIGLRKGTLAEQLQSLLSVLQDRASLLVLTPDTAASFTPPPHYEEGRLADLVSFRLLPV